MRPSEATDARPSRLALAVVLSTLSVAAIAGPLAFQALEVQKNEIRFGTVNPSDPTVGGISVTSTESTTSSPPSTQTVDVLPEDEPTETAPAPITSAEPPPTTVPTTEPSTAPNDTEPTLGQPVSVERTETIAGGQEPPDESSVPELQIPSSPGVQPTWVVNDPGTTEDPDQLPSTTVPSDPGSSTSTPPSTEGSTSGSVTTVGPAGPTITEPLEPIDTTLPSEPSTTTEPIDPVITEPLEPIDTTVPSTTIDPSSTSETTHLPVSTIAGDSTSTIGGSDDSSAPPTE
ncbi:MAG: hypothetical protein ACR2NL_01330 [Acidimicrobiia bacterium]